MEEAPWDPPAGRQFVAVAFKEGGRPYTYHNDGEPLALGQLVRVPVRHSEQSGAIVGIEDSPPPFETKPIIGLADAAEAQSEDQKEQ